MIYDLIEMDPDVGMWVPKGDEPGLVKRVQDVAIQEVPQLVSLCPRRTVVVQAGGHVGIWPGLLSQYFERVYTFEPNSVNFCCLNRNVGNEFRIFPFRAALGCDPGPRSMTQARKSGSHQVLAYSAGPTPVIALDSFNFDQLDLLALDVETFELQVLAGASWSIQKHSPIIMIEATGLDPTDGRTEKYPQKAEWLEGRGYQEIATINKDKIWAKK